MPANWNTLVSNIRGRLCIPFLGAGAVPTLPTGRELAEELRGAGDPGQAFPFPGSETNLAKVSQVRAALDGDAQLVKRRVVELLEARLRPAAGARVPPPDLHRALARLRLPVYLTTNYDTLIEDALAEANVPFHSEICRWNLDLRDEEPSIFDSTDADPLGGRSLVFHLHGRVDKPASLVLTEDDYLDFLLNVTRDVSSSVALSGSRVMLPFLIRKFIKTRPLVFVGYGLADVNFLVILRGLLRTVEPSGRVQRVAVHLDPGNLPPDADLTEVKEHIERYFDWTLNVEVFWGTADQFTQRLASALDGVPAAPEGPVSGPVPGASGD